MYTRAAAAQILTRTCVSDAPAMLLLPVCTLRRPSSNELKGVASDSIPLLVHIY
jgi:hypothetical protein